MFGRPSFDFGSRNINNFDKFPSNNAMNMNMNMSQNMMNNYSVNNINNFNQMQNPMMNTMMNMNNQFLGNNMYNTNINNISLEEAKKIYRDVRFYTHGIATQLCVNSIKLTKKELGDLIKNNIKINLRGN